MWLRRRRRERPVDPLIGNELAVLPFAVAQRETCRHPNGRRRSPTAPGSRRARSRNSHSQTSAKCWSADGVHNGFLEDLGQWAPPHIEGGERERIDPHIVVFIERVRFPARPGGPFRRIAVGPVSPSRACPTACLPSRWFGAACGPRLMVRLWGCRTTPVTSPPRRGHSLPDAHDELPSTNHWITSSAVANSVSGMVRPSVLAVLRLTTNRNLVGCTTGRSAGLAPLRILPK